ncbi:endonuclease/exonuclease/phosphatase family protein [Rheinheimera riviphila]|uniref:Endonuclease/exonuclease/phosphatase family protein n=1 Tax=Rheinheimera riviphila TaxID=1834037 RepID=A0A437QMI8_9GAMM|nr:endonuclease/exonuclease/phosphatase family protein [Rheinheimera riviphila]
MPATSSSASLRLSSLNLLNFTAPPQASYEFDNIYSSAQWQQKTDWLRRVLTDVAPDVLALQEVFSFEALQQLTSELGFGYFAVAGQPTLIDDHVYQKPVVALASKYPIVQSNAVQVPQAAANALGLSHFNFSRAPLRALVQLPEIGLCNCYVVHLKSRRPLALPQGQNLPAAEALSRWAACVQRGNEAGLLLEAITEQWAEDKLPVMLLGDFNDELSSPLLQILVQSLAQSFQPTAELSVDLGDAQPQPPDNVLQLQDSWIMQPEQPEPRPATHYYGAKGSVLDYILLSADFAPLVQRQWVVDQHLRQPVFAVDGYSSDHALVTVQLRPAAL